MNKYEVINEFLSGFNMPAYAVGSVPSTPEFPYLTYQLLTGDFMSGEMAMEVNLWFYTASEAAPDLKADEIKAAIGYGGKMLVYDGGALWIKRGSPWCQAIPDEAGNKMIKRRYINIDLEYITMD